MDLTARITVDPTVRPDVKYSIDLFYQHRVDPDVPKLEAEPQRSIAEADAGASIPVDEALGRLRYRERLERAIDEGLSDLQDGRVTSDADLTRELDKEFGPAI